jgi:molybdopterin molybdotransferase
MLELEEALQRILAATSAARTELIPVSESDGRFLTETVHSSLDLPPFDNSSMDGYAVRTADVAGATMQAPVLLRLAGKVAAGESFPNELAPGTCVRIFTGSPVPRGSDGVVMQEDTRFDLQDPQRILFCDAAEPGENVRRRGEDVRSGQRLVEKGERLGPGQISLLAATGVTQVSVGLRPIVGLLATGSELVEPTSSPAPLAPGQIYESNRCGLAVLAHRCGAIAKVLPLVPDNLSATRQALEQALTECDLVVTSGGVSVGEMDFLKQAFSDIGGELQFWKVAIKPGRPFVFGRRKEKFLFGLPGNPVSALVTFLILVRPALLRYQGATDISPPAHPGRLVEALSNDGGRRHFIRVKVDPTGLVHSAGTQASHILSSLAVANGLVDVPPKTTLPAGTTVTVLRWG